MNMHTGADVYFKVCENEKSYWNLQVDKLDAENREYMKKLKQWEEKKKAKKE